MGEQAWIDAAAGALAELQPPHVERKRATIIALVDAQLAGRPEQSVWGTPGVCNRGTYHLKWKFQPDFAAALASSLPVGARVAGYPGAAGVARRGGESGPGGAGCGGKSCLPHGFAG